VRDLGWEAREREREQGEATALRPLAGIRILDFTHVLAGPFGTRVLGDLGAEVIKAGTATRGAAANSPAHPYFAMWNRSKRNVSINMKSEGGKAVARRLAAASDIVIENFSAGVLARWGMDRPSLEDVNPGLTVISMAGMGHSGPWKDMVTYAPTIHALTGLTDLTGFPDNHLIGYGFSLSDHLSGLTAAIAVLEGVEHRRRTGRGLTIDLAQYQVGLHLLAPTIIDYYANGGRNPQPPGNRDPFAGRVQGIYPAAGHDRWVAISVQGDAQWKALAAAIDEPELGGDDRFATQEARAANHAVLDGIIAGWTASRDAYAVMEHLQTVGVPAGVVQNAEDMDKRDPQIAARDFFTTSVSDAIGEYRHERFPARFNGEPITEYLGVRDGGADTFEVLTSVLGLSDEEIAELVGSGALA
jgi:crotonobetainyl-CoA:carnitine CoA-transferase CaiB-like acyl-CoA transferase